VSFAINDVVHKLPSLPSFEA